MQEKKYFVYSFDELSEEQKQKAIDNYRDINTDYQDWHDFILEAWTEKLERQGFTSPEIHYSGFYSQGDGASFTAGVDLEKFLKGRRVASKYKKELKAYNAGELDINIDQSSPHYYHEYTMSIRCYDDIPAELESFILEEAREQASKIYKELRDEYEFQQSDEAIAETLRANDYQFTEDGKIDG